MRNKKKLMAMGLVMTLSAGLFSGCAATNEAEAAGSGKDNDGDETKESTVTHSKESGKTETVYVIKDADGNTKEKIVSTWIKNEKGSNILTDESNLENIEVVKGEAAYTKDDDGEIIWQTGGSDVYYQGTSEKELPIDVNVEYKLDGKKVTAAELEGASGYLEMTFTYENRTGREIADEDGNYTAYQPYAMVSGTIFDGSEAVNVNVTGGTCVNDGERTIVFGMAFPGLSKSLGLDEIEGEDGESPDGLIPDKVVVEADVTNFSKPITVTAATGDALSKLDLSEIESKEDLEEKLGELTGGMDEAVAGADALYEGLGSLSEGGNDLDEGADRLSSGAGELNNGAGALAAGTKKIKDGAYALNDGAKELNAGAISLQEGMELLVSSKGELVSGAAELNSGAKELSEGLAKLELYNKSLNDGAKKLADGVALLNSTLSSKKLEESMKTLTDGSDSYAESIGSLADGMATVTDGYSCGEGTELKTALDSLEAYAAAIKDSDPQTAAGILAVVKSYKELYAYTESFSEAAGGLSSAYAGIDGGIDALVSNVGQLSGSVKEIEAGADSLCDGITEYTTGVSGASDGADKLYGGTSLLGSKIPALSGGIDELYEGSGAIKDGSSALEAGAGELKSGADELYSGVLGLAQGIKELYDGTLDLKDGTGELKAGAEQLVSGSLELKNGMVKINDEGIRKISDAVLENLDKYYNRLEVLKELTEENGSYSGCSEEMDCTSVYIFKTE